MGRVRQNQKASSTATKARPRTTSTSKSTSTKPPAPVVPTDEAEWTYEHNCWAQTRGCFTRKTTPTDPSEPTRIEPEEVARELVVRLNLPDPTPRFGPDPDDNEWKMAAVGYPLWLWTDGPRRVSTTASRYGISFTLAATWRSTTFTMGDGHQVTCTKTKQYTAAVAPGAKSPSCGYAYAKASLPAGKYTVTATTHWTISWSALGQSGSFPGSHSASTRLPVGELNALVVG